jgi:hypothetical protein
MTASIQPESKSPSRRALLTGALGGIGALAATVIGRAAPVRAGVDGDVVLGANNTADTITKISNLTNVNPVLWAQSSTGIGVYGSSDTSRGVYGQSSSSVAVDSLSFASSQPAVLGWSSGNSTGVQGYSGPAAPAAPRPKTGVYGYANQDIYSTGTYGLSPLGVGVRGKTTSGYAGYFEGRVYTNAWYELGEVATPAAPLANRARLFVRDNGAGKTQLCVRFRTGAVQIIKTEP